VSAVAVEAFVNNAGQIEKQRVAELFGFRLEGMAKHTDIRLFALKKGSAGLRAEL